MSPSNFGHLRHKYEEVPEINYSSSSSSESSSIVSINEVEELENLEIIFNSVIENPRRALVQNHVNGPYVKVILVLENGVQILITFDLPNENCYVQDLIDQIINLNVLPTNDIRLIVTPVNDEKMEIKYVVEVEKKQTQEIDSPESPENADSINPQQERESPDSPESPYNFDLQQERESPESPENPDSIYPQQEIESPESPENPYNIDPRYLQKTDRTRLTVTSANNKKMGIHYAKEMEKEQFVRESPESPENPYNIDSRYFGGCSSRKLPKIDPDSPNESVSEESSERQLSLSPEKLFDQEPAPYVAQHSRTKISQSLNMFCDRGDFSENSILRIQIPIFPIKPEFNNGYETVATNFTEETDTPESPENSFDRGE